jgi:hypothetical protein
MSQLVYREKALNLVHDLVILECSVTLTTGGAVGSIRGNGLLSAAEKGAGIFLLTFDRHFNRILQVHGNVLAPVTGGAVNDGSLSASTLYRIVTVGTSDFTAVGAVDNVVGEAFVATGVGGSGTGTVKAIAASQMVSIQLASANLGNTDHIVVQLVDDAGAAVDGEAGAVLNFMILARRGSIKSTGES